MDRSFDLAISNVPFGDYKPFDEAFARQNFLIHDYFFAKAIEKVRPGGLLIFITSKGTLDKQNSTLRHHLSSEADFVGAIRERREPLSGAALARDVVEVIYAGYCSAGRGRRVEVSGR